MGVNCTSTPLQTSTRVSPGFILPRARSLGFGSYDRDSRPIKTSHLTSCPYSLLGRDEEHTSTRRPASLVWPKPRRNLGQMRFGMDHSPTVGELVRLDACSRFPFAFVDDPLKLATTINSPARVSRRIAQPWSSLLVLPDHSGFLQRDSTLSGRARLLPSGFRLF